MTRKLNPGGVRGTCIKLSLKLTSGNRSKSTGTHTDLEPTQSEIKTPILRFGNAVVWNSLELVGQNLTVGWTGSVRALNHGFYPGVEGNPVFHNIDLTQASVPHVVMFEEKSSQWFAISIRHMLQVQFGSSWYGPRVP